MNLFILDSNPVISASYHVDRHVVKMPTETAQMISFVYHDPELWQGEIPEFIMGFSKTHYKHPCSIWIRQSLSNFISACKLGLALYNEYQYRYNQPEKHQRAKQIFEFAFNNPPAIPDQGLTKFVVAMDEVYQLHECPVQNYRVYYKLGKPHLHNWSKREKPFWL